MGRPAEEGESPVGEARKGSSGILSTAGHEEPSRKQLGPSGKPKYEHVTDSDKYSEGKVKRTPGGE